MQVNEGDDAPDDANECHKMGVYRCILCEPEFKSFDYSIILSPDATRNDPQTTEPVGSVL